MVWPYIRFGDGLMMRISNDEHTANDERGGWDTLSLKKSAALMIRKTDREEGLWV